MIDFKIDKYNQKEKIQKIFQYYKKHGFPNYNQNKYDKNKELQKLINFNESNIFIEDKKIIKQTMHSCGFLWTYFPHWIEVRCKNDMSLIDNWNDDIKLYSLIEKTYNYILKHGNGNWTENRIRQNAKVYCSKQSVSNFRPTVAKFIYNKFGNSGTVWDMSCGWGGRLFGFLASNCKKYIGTDPSTRTYEGLEKIKKDYTYIQKEIELHKIGSEDFCPEENSVDLCFTSPPYFDTEKYSEEQTQSYIKFPTIQKWVHGFLEQTFINCKKSLKSNGKLIINIANIDKYDLEDITINTAIKCGFELEDKYLMELSSISGKGAKFEPIFIFKKIA